VINNWQRYGQKPSATFFGPPCINVDFRFVVEILYIGLQLAVKQNHDEWKQAVFLFINTLVHVRLRECFGSTRVSCVCAVVVHEFNNVLGVFACQPGQPPIPVRYLIDEITPAPDIITSTSDPSLYTVLSIEHLFQ